MENKYQLEDLKTGNAVWDSYNTLDAAMDAAENDVDKEEIPVAVRDIQLDRVVYSTKYGTHGIEGDE